MRRNRKKMTFIAALCLLAALASACQKQPEGEEVIDSIEVQSEEPSQEVTFQNQYDLGMRLLSEGSYEEAIIAFTAALEIDPKSVDVYTALADTYEAMGDTEGLRRILEQGIEATGDAGLQERLDRMPPLLPKKYGWDEMPPYVAADEELESILSEAIEAGLAGNREILEDALWNAQLAQEIGTYLKECLGDYGFGIGFIYEDENGSYTTCRFWTVLSDDAFLCYDFAKVGQGLNYLIIYSPESGSGFHSRVKDYTAENLWYVYDLVLGEVAECLFNGSFSSYHYEDYGGGDIRTTQSTGNAANNLLEGEKVSIIHLVGQDGEQTNYTEYDYFKDGKGIARMDEDGQECYGKTVYESGEVRYYHSATSQGPYPWTN